MAALPKSRFISHASPPACGLRLFCVIDAGLIGSKNCVGVPREQKMLKGHLPRVIYHQVCVKGYGVIVNNHGSSILVYEEEYCEISMCNPQVFTINP